MSNPYGGGYPPYEPGNNPYDPAPSYGSPRAPYDGLSVAALVCSLTCCAAPVGIGLGIAGLVRTKDGKRSGRWAAVTGLALGAVVLVAGLGFAVFAMVMGSRTVWEDEARVGQCIDLDFFDDPVKASCGEPHAGEVVWVGTFDTDLAEVFDHVSVAEFCHGLPGLDPAYASAIESGDYAVRIETDSFDEDDPDRGDAFFCYLEARDGEKLDGRLRDAGRSTGA
ncbi:DUF4190 domain-containing protein [Nocardioides daeguensis]|uniref:DUF4190 domain-containing protein n=1 Tax=Nocardioides daeguensis TaxID=908359 RepID=A0ABP6WI84_9ACTN|nr:DUF4190 domain-containing protein [Nocardioides daeguensis]MBV6729078.1 hypothetical protein [Nocardioides daeguensis]MCR1774918.1 hypothetical protein [Nocardioides daeguensis]